MKITHVIDGFVNVVDKHKPSAVMIFVQFIYAGMALFSKAAIDKGMSPSVFVVYRQALASLALAPFAFFLERNKVPSLSCKLLCKIFLVSFFGVTLSLNLFCIAINNTSATFAAATANAIPAITFIMAALLGMEKICIRNANGIAKMVGFVVSVSGALVFAFLKGPTVSFLNWSQANHGQIHKTTNYSNGGWIKGPLLMLTANTFWSLWIVLQGPIVMQYPLKLRLTTLQCLFSCIQSAVWAIAVERNPSKWKLGWNLHLLSVAYCGIIVTGITYWLQVWAIGKRGPVYTSMFTPLTLIITAIFSALLWNESLHWGSVGGAILLICGLYCVLWGKSKENIKRPIPNEEDSQTNKEETKHDIEIAT